MVKSKMKLLPCPFCGCNTPICGFDTAITVDVFCPECKAQGAYFKLANKWPKGAKNMNDIQRGLMEKAAEAWNRRIVQKLDSKI